MLAPAVVLAIVGFFVVPVVGAPLFFVASIYLIELLRVGPAQAWPTTRASVGAVAVSVGIEFAADLVSNLCRHQLIEGEILPAVGASDLVFHNGFRKRGFLSPSARCSGLAAALE